MRVLTCFPVHLTTHAGSHMFSSPFNNTCGYSHVFQLHLVLHECPHDPLPEALSSLPHVGVGGQRGHLHADGVALSEGGDELVRQVQRGLDARCYQVLVYNELSRTH